jgi:hypothetical protein
MGALDGGRRKARFRSALTASLESLEVPHEARCQARPAGEWAPSKRTDHHPSRRANSRRRGRPPAAADLGACTTFNKSSSSGRKSFSHEGTRHRFAARRPTRRASRRDRFERLRHLESVKIFICRLRFVRLLSERPQRTMITLAVLTQSFPTHISRTGGLHDVERKARSEAQARGESGTGAGGCRFIVASR